MNNIVISGNLVADVPALRDAGDNKVTDIRVAVRGRGKDDTTFVDVTLWNQTAETAEKYLAKGSFVIIEGRLKQDTWQDKDSGENRSKLKIIANGLDLGPKISAPAESGNAAAAPAAGNTAADDDDVPF